MICMYFSRVNFRVGIISKSWAGDGTVRNRPVMCAASRRVARLRSSLL